MARFSDLPAEIQLLIATHIPKSELFLLKSLNSFFLDCWMVMAWKYVMIDTDLPVRSVRLLLRVVDPFVATRVKTFAIYLMVIEPASDIACKVMSLLLYSLPRLPNITYLIIELRRQRSSYFPPLLQTILSSSLPRRLRKLRISGHAHMFASVEYSSHSPFENLTELDLSLSYWDHSDTQQTPILQPSLSLNLVPILRSLAPTLRCLHFSNWLGILDLFDLFNTLNQSDSSVPVPNLQSLSLSLSSLAVSIPQSSLQSLHRFLVTHGNNLQHLHLTQIFPPSHPVVDELLGAWLVNLVDSKIQFPSLQTLQLHPPTSKMGMSALLTLIKRTVATLSSLTIPFHYLEDEEMNQLLDALTFGVQPTTNSRSSKLKVLDISIAHLSVSFLDLLAHRLPQLETLTLNIWEVVDSDMHTFYDLLIQRRYDRRDIDTSISASDSTQDVLHTWKLRHISIRKYGELRDAVHAVAGAVPSVVLHY